MPQIHASLVADYPVDYWGLYALYKQMHKRSPGL